MRPINRIKHVIDSQGAAGIGTPVVQNLVESTDTPTLAQAEECETGSKVNGFFLVVEAYATTAGALSNFYMQVRKNPGGNLTFVNGNLTGTSDNKKYVFHEEMVMLQKLVNGIPRTVFKGVIVIPKHLQRNGPNDLIEIALFSPGVNVDFCYEAHYKEFR